MRTWLSFLTTIKCSIINRQTVTNIACHSVHFPIFLQRFVDLS